MASYYKIRRNYSVKADSPKDAKVKFSRALENHEEDQYYVGTDFGFTQNVQSADTKKSGLALRILTILIRFFGWFFRGAIDQATYTAPKKPKQYRRY